MPKEKPRYCFNLVLVFASGMLALLLGEGILRAAFPQPLEQIDPGLYQPDPPRRFRLTPGYRGTISNGVDFTTPVVIDSRGMRAPEIRAPEITANEQAAGKPRILVLGDSFTFGWGVAFEETFPGQLQERLPAARVENAGVPGFGLPDIVDWFEAYGLARKPDVVIVAIFLGNDLLDATAKQRQIDVTAPPLKRSAWRQIEHALFTHSHQIRLLKRALPEPLARRLRQLTHTPEPWAIGYLRDTLETCALTPPPLAQEGRAASEAAIVRLTQLAKSHGFRLVVALVPGPLQASPTHWQAALQQTGADPSRYSPDVPATFFTAATTAAGIPTLDLTPTFRQAVAAERAVYFRFDPHWTPAGHRLAATVLADFLAALPPAPS